MKRFALVKEFEFFFDLVLHLNIEQAFNLGFYGCCYFVARSAEQKVNNAHGDDGKQHEVRAKVEEYNRNGCTCPILYPLGDDVQLTIDTFAQA